MEFGRIQCVLVATSVGDVVYERFYDKFSDLERADIRAAFYSTTEPYLQSLADGAEYAARFKSAAVVARTEGDLFFYGLGNGEYDELSLSEVIDVIIQSLRDILKRQPSEGLLWDNYGRLCLLIDEIVNEGVIDATDKEAIQRGIRLKE
ncbi:hypothetical protein WJX84_008038 [Apatococcus fuscideae]|uniref:Coatomer subunit zeta n=1 Tax=Apatococcus fuscideae TaxID=2026836 RepID=A0AAW1SW65_9CHLO